MKFSFFSFGWLTSSERAQKKEELELKKAEIALKERELQIEEFSIKKNNWQEEIKIPLKPFKSLRVIGKTCMVVLNDGTTLSMDAPELLGDVRQAQSEEEIIELFTKYETYTEKEEETEEKALVVSNLGILKGHEDFLVKGDEVYLKGVNLAIPPIVLASFIELLEAVEMEVADATGIIKQYEALKMFWYWAALNPIESSRKSLIDFIRKNDITITANGLLLMYRKVVKKKGDNHELIEFISNQYFKIKKWKKSPANYEVWKNGEIFRCSEEKYIVDWGERIGNLEELYLDLPNMQGHSYTDGHTRKKDIRIGAVYKESEDKINLNNDVSCGAGLHVGSRQFGFDGFGDTGVIALVNPMYVRSVPNHECSKMRVSEMFIVNVAELSEYEELVEDGEVLDYSKEYCSETLEELEQMIKDKRIDKITCQENLPAISIIDVEAIRNMLKERIVKV